MKTLKLLPVLLLAAAASGCVNEELLPQSAEYDEDLAAVTELAAEEPSQDDDGTPPGSRLPPDFGICGEIIVDVPGPFIVGDYTIAELADVAFLAEVVAITGDLSIDVAIDEVVDLSALSDIRCIGGDVRIKDDGYFSLDEFPSLSYIGGVLLVDDAGN